MSRFSILFYFFFYDCYIKEPLLFLRFRFHCENYFWVFVVKKVQTFLHVLSSMGPKYENILHVYFGLSCDVLIAFVSSSSKNSPAITGDSPDSIDEVSTCAYFWKVEME